MGRKAITGIRRQPAGVAEVVELVVAGQEEPEVGKVDREQWLA